jgi:hypothetical protein
VLALQQELVAVGRVVPRCHWAHHVVHLKPKIAEAKEAVATGPSEMKAKTESRRQLLSTDEVLKRYSRVMDRAKL